MLRDLGRLDRHNPDELPGNVIQWLGNKEDVGGLGEKINRIKCLIMKYKKDVEDLTLKALPRALPELEELVLISGYSKGAICEGIRTSSGLSRFCGGETDTYIQYWLRLHGISTGFGLDQWHRERLAWIRDNQ